MARLESVDTPGNKFAPLSPSAQLGLTLGPVGGFGLILSLTAMLESPQAAVFLASIAAGMFAGGGKLVILAGCVDRAPVGPWALGALIVYVDLATALIVIAGMQYLYRLRAVGRRLAAAREAGGRVLERNPWMHRVTWLSLAGFVAVPFQGTGAILGVLIGRLLGLSRLAIVTATGLGSLFASLTIALVGDYWEERIAAIAGRPLLGFVVVLVIAGVMILGSHWLFGRASEPVVARGDTTP